METEKAIEIIQKYKNDGLDIWRISTSYECEELREAIETILKELEKKNKTIDEIKSKLEEHIQYCKQEAQGSLHNEICHISLKFDESLLNILKKKSEESE